MEVIKKAALITLVVALLLVGLWLALNPSNIPVLGEWIQYGFCAFLDAVFASVGAFLASMFFFFVVICVLVWVFG